MNDQQDSRQLIAAAILPESGPLSAAQREAGAAAIQKYMEARKLRDADISRASDIPLPEVRRAIRGTGADDILRDVSAWIELDARRVAAKRPKLCVPTAVAKAMKDAAVAAHRTGDVALCTGPSGIGKTYCCREIAATIPGTIYVHVGVNQASMTRLLHAVYGAAGRGQGHPSGVESALVSLLTGSGRLLIVDQAHKLRDRALEWLFDLHSETGCPMLLTGTVAIRRRLDADADPAFGQMSSRVGIRVNLVTAAMRSHGGDMVFAAAELRQIFSPSGGKIRLAPDTTAMLVQVANVLGRGSLRLCARLVWWAARLARKRAGLGPDEAATIYAQDLRAAEAALDDSIAPDGIEAGGAGSIPGPRSADGNSGARLAGVLDTDGMFAHGREETEFQRWQ